MKKNKRLLKDLQKQRELNAQRIIAMQELQKQYDELHDDVLLRLQRYLGVI